MKKDNNVIENFPLFRPVHCSTPVVIKNPKMQQYLNSGYKCYDRENKVFVSFNDVVDFIRPACYSVFEYLDAAALSIPKNVFIKGYSNISLYNIDTDYLVCDERSSDYFKGIKRYYYYKYTNSIEYLCTRYYFVDNNNRVVDQCFIAVSCNKCLICNRKKINNISQMCVFQTEECKFLPFFVTLTYNKDRYVKRTFDFKYTYYKVINNEEKKFRENLSLSPLLSVESLKVSQYKDGSALRSFVVDELQRFLKRLRIGLKRAGLEVKLKYYFVSEIGKKGRLHYHGLIWLCPETSSEVLNKLYTYNLYYVKSGKQYVLHNFTHYIQQAWSEFDFENNKYVPFGNVRSYVSQSSEVVNYINKYINKDTIFGSPKYSLKSCLLGVAAFKDKIADNLRDSPGLDSYCFTSRFDGKPRELKVTSYYLNKFLPSLTKSLSKEYRDNLYDAFQLYNKYNYEMYNLDTSLYDVSIRFEKYLMPLISFLDYDKMPCSLFEDIYIDTETGEYDHVFDRFYFLCLWLFQQEETMNIEEYINLSCLREVHMQNINLDFDLVYEMMEIMKNNERYNQKNNDNQ